MQKPLTYYDIFQSDVDEASRCTKRFTLWPRAWDEYNQKLQPSGKWKIHAFNKRLKYKIPQVKGIYSFIVKPHVAHHENTYLMYIGKSQNLRRRFLEYLRKRDKGIERPQIILLLRQYSDKNLFFRYIRLDVQDNLSKIEKDLISAFAPPCNDLIPGKMGKIIKAIP